MTGTVHPHDGDSRVECPGCYRQSGWPPLYQADDDNTLGFLWRLGLFRTEVRSGMRI